jgi:hypothetical protein
VIEDQHVGVVEATEPEGVGGRGCREHLESVVGELLAELVEGRPVPVADDQGRDLFYRRHGLPPGDPLYLPFAMWSSFGFGAPVVNRTRKDVRSLGLPLGPRAILVAVVASGPVGDVAGATVALACDESEWKSPTICGYPWLSGP